MTGALTLGVGVAAYMISKEIYIINNETVLALIMGGVVYALIRKIGKPATDYIDARNQVCLPPLCRMLSKYASILYPTLSTLNLSLSLQRIQDRFYEFHNSQISEVEDAIADQKRLDQNLEVRHDIFSVLRVSGRVPQTYTL